MYNERRDFLDTVLYLRHCGFSKGFTVDVIKDEVSETTHYYITRKKQRLVHKGTRHNKTVYINEEVIPAIEAYLAGDDPEK